MINDTSSVQSLGSASSGTQPTWGVHQALSLLGECIRHSAYLGSASGIQFPVAFVINDQCGFWDQYSDDPSILCAWKRTQCTGKGPWNLRSKQHAPQGHSSVSKEIGWANQRMLARFKASSVWQPSLPGAYIYIRNPWLQIDNITQCHGTLFNIYIVLYCLFEARDFCIQKEVLSVYTYAEKQSA